MRFPGNNMKTYIIAEIGNTHEGSLGLAKQFVVAAKDCGADAVKFQTHIFDSESLPDAPNPPYFKDETRKEYFRRTALTVQQWRELKRYCEEEVAIDFFSSPFSLEAVDLLEEIGIRIYKIPSGEVTNVPLLVKIAKTRKKVLLSSGMSSWCELDEAVEALRQNGCEDIVILQCTSEYPCQPEHSGLNVISELKNRYPDIPIGYSDHTVGYAIPIAAVVLGVTVIEKHFTLSHLMYGSDAANATEPNEFAKMVKEIRNVEKALENYMDKDKLAKDLYDMKIIFEKSLVSACPIPVGTKLRDSMLAFKKPGNGIPARKYKEFLGRTLIKSVEKNHQFHVDEFE
jgi:sialic acid synthase SpsE